MTVEERQSAAGTASGHEAVTTVGSGSHYWGFAKRALRAALLGHALFIVLFYAIGVPALALVNIVSVALYALCIRLVDRKRFTAITLLVRMELYAHALIASWVVGWDSGFHYYALLPPLLLFINDEKIAAHKLGYALLLIGLYILLDAVMSEHAPLIVIDADVLQAVRIFNIASYLGTVAYLAHLYSEAVMLAERRLQVMATTDTLTGLKNRRHIIDIAEYEVRRNKRARRPMAIILCDLDNFKAINDTYGHACGDRVLQRMAQVLLDCVRGEDCVGRWGGEEFVVLLPDTSLEGAMRVAERIRQSVAAQKMHCATNIITLTLTLGVSECSPADNFDHCIARADAALYRGKEAGRNRTELAQ